MCGTFNRDSFIMFIGRNLGFFFFTLIVFFSSLLFSIAQKVQMIQLKPTWTHRDVTLKWIFFSSCLPLKWWKINEHQSICCTFFPWVLHIYTFQLQARIFISRADLPFFRDFICYSAFQKRAEWNFVNTKLLNQQNGFNHVGMRKKMAQKKTSLNSSFHWNG